MPEQVKSTFSPPVSSTHDIKVSSTATATAEFVAVVDRDPNWKPKRDHRHRASRRLAGF